MCAENDRRCRWTRTERPTVANVCRKRQNMSLDAQIGEARGPPAASSSAVHPVTRRALETGRLLPEVYMPYCEKLRGAAADGLGIGAGAGEQDRVVGQLDAGCHSGRVEHEDVAVGFAIERQRGDRQVADVHALALVGPER